MKKYISIQTWLSSNPSEKEVQKVLDLINKTNERRIKKEIRLAQRQIKILFEAIANTIQFIEQKDKPNLDVKLYEVTTGNTDDNSSYVQFLGYPVKSVEELTSLNRDIKNQIRLVERQIIILMETIQGLGTINYHLNS